MSLDERFEATSSKADALMARLTAARDPTRSAATTFALPDPSLRSSLRAPYRPLATRQLVTPSDATAPAAAAAPAPPPPAIQPSAFTAHKLPSARAARPAAATARQRERHAHAHQDGGNSSVPVRPLAFLAAAAPSSDAHGGA
jgi:hypothetical protein